MVSELHPRARDRDYFQQFVSDHVTCDALGLRVEVHEHAMTKNRLRKGANVLEAHVGAAVHECASLAAQDEVLRRTNGRAVRDVLLDDVRRIRTRTARPRDVYRI